MKILSTKQLDSALSDMAMELGAEIDSIEVIDIQPVANNSSLSLFSLDAVVFTSSNAVKYAWDMEEIKTLVLSKAVYSISGKTKQELLERGIDIEYTADDSEALAELIIADTAVRSVLHICGDLSLDTLSRRLKAAGISYDPLPVYHTELLYPLVRQDYDAVLFFSPSGVDSFLKNNKPDTKAIYCSVGSTTAAHLRAVDVSLDVITAERPEPENMIRTTIAYHEIRSKK